MKLVSNWLGHAGRIAKLSCQYKGMDVPDKEMVFSGKVVRKVEENGRRLVELQLSTVNADGQQTTPGQAVVVFR